MATVTIGPFRVYQTYSGGPSFRIAVPELASQTFKRGAIVVAGTGGKITEGSADPTRILGVAEEDAHNVAVPTDADVCHFAVANEDTLFVGNVSTGQTTALTDIGGSYGVTKVGDNWTIDKTKATTSRRVRIINLDPRDAVGDIQGRLIFQFLGDYSGYIYTS